MPTNQYAILMLVISYDNTFFEPA